MGVKKERPTPKGAASRKLAGGVWVGKGASPRTRRNAGLFRNPRLGNRSSLGPAPDTVYSVKAQVRAAATVRPSGPIQFALRLGESWCLSQDDLAGLLGFGPGDTAHAAALLTGRAELHGRDVRDRLVHLFRIRETLHSLLRDLEVENEWLREPHELLDGRSPMSLMVGGSMEDLLLVREYVDEVAGS